MRLDRIMEYLRESNAEVLFLATFGSYGTEDWTEYSDIDIFIVVDTMISSIKKLRKKNNIDIIISTPQTLQFSLAPPFLIDLAFSEPIVDKIGLKERCLKQLRSTKVIRWLINRLRLYLRIIKHLMEHVNTAGRICGSESIETINILRLAWSVIKNRRVTRREIIRNIEQSLGITLESFIQQYYERKERGRLYRISIDSRCCSRVLNLLKKMINETIERLAQINSSKNHDSVSTS